MPASKSPSKIKPPRSARARVHELLTDPSDADALERGLNWFLVGLIFLNVVAVVLETVEAVYLAHAPAFELFEGVSVAVFALEYALRIWSCTEDPRYAHPITGRLRFALRPLVLIDLLAILPFFLPLKGLDTRMIRAVRLIRIFRLFKATRYSRSLDTVYRVLRAKRDELLVTLVLVGIVLVLVSSLMFAVEHDEQPEAFSSIPASMWWGMMTLTTVGYGDIAPHTALGKFCGMAISLLGVGIFALPAAILGSGFVDELQKHRKPPVCIHCGKKADRH
ncbi:MAG: ion transporter [Minicystis sp.]